jgi:NAD(P)-dependent dehydrogenase (short-subunit alcohol dehydrogenase family)
MGQKKVAVITGGANGIGKCIAEEFLKAGVKVYDLFFYPSAHVQVCSERAGRNHHQYENPGS